MPAAEVQNRHRESCRQTRRSDCGGEGGVEWMAEAVERWIVQIGTDRGCYFIIRKEPDSSIEKGE